MPRRVEWQAVLRGGGFNRRNSLPDEVLMKDNRIAAAGGFRPKLEAVQPASRTSCVSRLS